MDWIKKTQWTITSSPALTDVRLLFSGPVPLARGSGAPPLRCLLTPQFGFSSPGSLWWPLGQHFLHQTVRLSVCLPCWMGHSEARNRPSSSDSQGPPRSWWQGLPANICKMSKFTAASPFSPPPRGLFPVDPSRNRCTRVPPWVLNTFFYLQSGQLAHLHVRPGRHQLEGPLSSKADSASSSRPVTPQMLGAPRWGQGPASAAGGPQLTSSPWLPSESTPSKGQH